MLDLARLYGRCAGKRMLVLGCGPSLKRATLPAVPVARTIGCNRILRTHEAGLIVVVDRDVWLQERERIRKHGCGVVASRELAEQFPDDLDHAYELQRSQDAPLDAMTGPFRTAQITGYYATAIAMRMAHPGGSVVLAGMDLEWRPGQPTHSFCEDGRAFGCSPKPLPEGRLAIARLLQATSVGLSIIGPSKLIELGVPPFVPHSRTCSES